MNRKILGIARRVWCHITAATVSIIFVAPLTFMALERADPVTIHSQELTGDFVPGGTINLTWSATAHKYCDGVSRARVISSGSIIYEYAPQPTVIRSHNNERGTYHITFQLPANIARGIAHREAHISYYCNPLHRWLGWPIRAVRSYGPFEIK